MQTQRFVIQRKPNYNPIVNHVAIILTVFNVKTFHIVQTALLDMDIFKITLPVYHVQYQTVYNVHIFKPVLLVNKTIL